MKRYLGLFLCRGWPCSFVYDNAHKTEALSSPIVLPLQLQCARNCVDNFPNSGLSQSLLTSRTGLRHQRTILLSPTCHVDRSTCNRGVSTCPECGNFCVRCCLILRIGNNSRIVSLTIHTAANNPTARLDNSSVLLVAFRGLSNLNCSTKFTLIAGAKVSPSAVLVLLCYSSSSSCSYLQFIRCLPVYLLSTRHPQVPHTQYI